MAIKFTSLLAQRSGSMYKERVGERGITHASANDKEELDLRIYNTTMAFEQSWQIKHDGVNASKLTADFVAEELESTFPLAKFSGESRIENQINVGDLSGTAPAIIADASAANSAYLELSSIFKAEQDATTPKVSIYDVDVIIGSANAQTASKSLTAQLHTYSFEASNEFVAGFSGAYILSLNMSKAALQSSADAEIKNLTSSQSLSLAADAHLAIEEAAYRITDKLSASEIYKVSPRTATAEPLFEQNGSFTYTIEGTGAGEGIFQIDGGGTDKHLMNVMQDGVVMSGPHFSIERDPMGAGGPNTSVTIMTNQYVSQVHQSFLIQQKQGMAQGQFKIEGDIGSTQFNGVAGQSDMLLQHSGAAAGTHHIRLSNGGVDIGQKLQVQGDAAFAMELFVVDKITGFNDLEISQNASIGGNLVVTGDLTVNGATVEVQGTQVTFEDTIFDMGQDNAGAGTLNASLDLGFMMNYEDGGVAKKSSIYWDTSELRFKLAAEASETAGIISSIQPAELELGRLFGASAELDLLAADEIRLGKSANSFANAEIGLKVGNAPGSAEFKVSSLLHADESGSSINLMADNQSIQGATAAGKLNFEQIEVSINETTQSTWNWYDGQGATKASILEIGGKILVGDVSSEFSKDLSVGGPLTNGLDIPAPIFSVDGSAYVKQDLEVDGVLYAASASFAQSDFQSLEADLLHLESDEVRFIMAEPEDALVADMGSSAVEHFSIILPGAATALGRAAEIKSSLPLNLDADADIQGNVVLQAKLSVAQEASFLDKLNVAKKLTASDEVDLAASGKATAVKGTLSVAEAAVLSSTLQVVADLTAQSNLSVALQSTLTGDVAMGADASVAGNLSVSGQINGSQNAVISGNVNATDMIASNEISAAKDILSGQDIYVKRDLIPGDKAGASGVQNIGQSAKPFENAYISSINADDASLTADLSVGGDLSVAGESTLTGDVEMGAKLDVASDATFGSKLDAAGDATLSSKLSVGGDASLSAKLSVAQLASFANNIDVTGQADISTDANIGGDLSVTGEASIGQDIDADGAMDLAGKLEFAAAGLTSRSRGSLIIDEDLTVTGASVLSGADFSGDVDIAGKLNVQSDTTVVKLDATGSISTTQGLSVTKTAVIGADASVGADLTVTGDYDLTGRADLRSDVQVYGDLQADQDVNISGKLDVAGSSDLAGQTTIGTALAPANFEVHGTSTLQGNVLANSDLGVTGDIDAGAKLTVAGDSDLQNLKVNAQSQLVGDAQFDAALKGSSLTARFEWGGNASGSQSAQPGYNFHVKPAANFAGDVHIDQNLNVDGTINGNNINISGNFQNHIDIEQPYAVRWRDSANSGVAGFLQGQDNRILAKSTDFDFSFSLEGMDGGLTSNIQVHAPQVTPAQAFKAFDLGTITDSGWIPAQAHSAGTSAAKWMITCRANESISGTDTMNSRTSALAQGMQYKLNKEDSAVAYAKGNIVYLSTIVAGSVCKDLPQNEGDHVVIVGKVIEDSANGTPIVYVAISMHYMYRI